MISDNSAFDDFIRDHRWAVLTHLKRDGAPASSVVAYAVDGDSLVVSTPGQTQNAGRSSENQRPIFVSSVTRNPLISSLSLAQ